MLFVSIAQNKLTLAKLYKTVFSDILNTLASLYMSISKVNKVKHETTRSRQF